MMHTARQAPLRFEWLSPAAIASEGPQVRRDWRHDDGAEKLHGLEESIRQHGVLQPLLVRSVPQQDGRPYQLVAGHRRLTAARRAGLESVPVLVRDLDDDDKDLVQLLENLQRQNLSAIDEAVAMQNLLQKHGWTQVHLAAILGVSSSFVSQRTLLLRESLLRDAVEGGLIAPTTATLLRQCGDDEVTRPLYERLERGERVQRPEVEAARLEQDAAAQRRRTDTTRLGGRLPRTEEAMRVAARLRAEGKSPAEIALTMGLSEGSINAYLRRQRDADMAATHQSSLSTQHSAFSPAHPADVPRDVLRQTAVSLRRDGLTPEAIGVRIGVGRDTVRHLLVEADAATSEQTDVPVPAPSAPKATYYPVSDALPAEQARDLWQAAGLPTGDVPEPPSARSTQRGAEDTPREYYSRDPAQIVVEAPGPRSGLVREQGLAEMLDAFRSGPCWLPLGRLLVKAARDGLSAADVLVAYRARG